MKTRRLGRHVVLAASLGAQIAQAQLVSQPVGTPNVPGCSAPRSWRAERGYYQCLMPPVSPGGTSPGGSDGVESALAVCNPIMDRMENYLKRSTIDRIPTATWTPVNGDYRVTANGVVWDPSGNRNLASFKTANGGNLGTVVRASDRYVVSDAPAYGALVVSRPGWYSNQFGTGPWNQYLWIASCIYTPARQQILLTWKNWQGADPTWTPCPIFGNRRGDVCWDSARGPGGVFGPTNNW